MLCEILNDIQDVEDDVPGAILVKGTRVNATFPKAEKNYGTIRPDDLIDVYVYRNNEWQFWTVEAQDLKIIEPVFS